MATVFWDRTWLLTVEFMQHGTTILSEMYCLRNTKTTRRAIQNKRRGMLTHGVVLLHHIARPNTSTTARTRALIQNFNWEFFDHPLYSSNLAPSDYYLFTNLKNWLRSQRFNSNEEMMESVKTWLSSQVADFFNTGIQNLISWYSKCLNSGDVYVEKQLKYMPIFCV
jgi:histone-lysine N-methyltransferase SETMAR